MIDSKSLVGLRSLSRTACFLLFSLVLLNCTYLNQFSLIKEKQCWNDIDFTKMEKFLKTSKIIEKSVFQAYPKKKNKLPIYLLLFDNGVKAVFKPNRPLLDQVSALRAYHFSQLLNLKLVPPTVVRTVDRERGIVQLFIESEASHLEDHLSSSQKGDIYLFHVVIGELDPARINTLIGKECKYPALVDNEKNMDRQRFSLLQHGDFPYFKAPTSNIKQIKSDLNFFDYESFPFHLAKSVKNFSSLRYNLETLKKKLSDIKPKTVAVLFKEPSGADLSKDTLHYIQWKNTLWFKINFEKFIYLYKNFAFSSPSKQTIKKFKSLNHKDLHFLSSTVKKSFNKEEGQKIMEAVKPFDSFILYRRDMILREYEKP